MFGAISIPPQPRVFCGPCLWPCGVSLSPALRLSACASSLPPSLCPRGLAGGCPLLRRGGLGGLGAPVAASPCVALRQSRRKSIRESRKSRRHSRSPLYESRWQSRKRLRQSRSFSPQNHSRFQNSVYKGGVFLAGFPGIDGKSCKSRSVSAHFTSKSLASMYFCWSCSGVMPSICGWFGVKTISCLSTMP